MIRQAKQSDIPKILEMYKLGLEELGETVFNESMMLDKVLSSYHLAPCYLLIKNGIIIGMAGLTIETSPWNGDATLSEYMFYVYPEHRNIKNLSGLVNKCKGFAASLDVPLRLEFATEVNEKIRTRLFRMHGFDICAIVGMYEKEAA